jgi:hypothetical protein
MILQKVNRILNHKYFVGFCIATIIIAFALFQLLNPQIKYEIMTWIQYPLILLPLVILIVFLSNFNVCLAIIMLVFLLAIIMPVNKPFTSINISSNEGFESSADEIDAAEKETNTQYYIDGIKNLVTGRIKKIQKEQNNAMSKGILENKQKILDNEKMKNSKNNSRDEESTYSDKVIQKRLFNPNKEEDTNLLITKEILLDMINRIEYNYENTAYLRKYIKSRIEEIIDTNDLLDDDL